MSQVGSRGQARSLHARDSAPAALDLRWVSAEESRRTVAAEGTRPQSGVSKWPAGVCDYTANDAN